MSRGRLKAPTQRQKRVGEELRHALAWVLERGDMRDPVLASTPVTVTEVRASPDLRNATVYITPLGGGDATEVLSALGRAAPFLRHEIARRVELRVVPRLSFQADTTFDEFSHIDQILHSPEVVRDLDTPDYGADFGDDEAETADSDADGAPEDRGHGA